MRFSVVFLLALAATPAWAAPATFAEPDLDRWMYPFNSTPGARATGSLFGNLAGNPAFDQRDAQVVLGFNTAVSGSAPIPSGLGAANYQVNSARVTVTIAGGAFEYDPTYDDVDSYTGADSDLGRPIELFGVGFRNGYSHFGGGPSDGLPPAFEESSPFAAPGAPSAGVRNVFALGFDGSGAGFDVSNNVAQGIDPVVMSIGQMAVAPGTIPAVGSTVTFDLDLNAPGVLDYLRAGLDQGQLGFALSSLSPAAMGGPITYPTIYLREDATGAPPTLELDVQLIPEPASLVTLALGSILAAGFLRRR